MKARCLSAAIILTAATATMPPWMADCPDLIGNASVSANVEYWKREEYLATPVRYEITADDGTVTIIEIQTGFPTDGASIPSLLAAFAGERFDWPVLWGAILHDWLYASNYFGPDGRDKADDCLWKLWLASGIDPKKAFLMYEAVRVGGGNDYDDCAAGAAWYRKFGKVLTAAEAAKE